MKRNKSVFLYISLYACICVFLHAIIGYIYILHIFTNYRYIYCYNVDIYNCILIIKQLDGNKM